MKTIFIQTTNYTGEYTLPAHKGHSYQFEQVGVIEDEENGLTHNQYHLIYSEDEITPERALFNYFTGPFKKFLLLCAEQGGDDNLYDYCPSLQEEAYLVIWAAVKTDYMTIDTADSIHQNIINMLTEHMFMGPDPDGVGDIDNNFLTDWVQVVESDIFDNGYSAIFQKL